jgi:6-phosphogluconolactonase
MKVSSICAALALSLVTALGDQEPFYIGTYTNHNSSRGIYQGTIDSVTGALGPIAPAAAASDPSFLALSPHGDALYAADETPGSGWVEAFQRSGKGGLTELNREPAGGIGTCHVSVDPSGRDVLVANYNSGSIACFRLLPGGAIGARTALISYKGSGPNLARQAAPHAHSIYTSPDGAYVYACDLGTDHVWIFKFDAEAGTLQAVVPPAAEVPPGSGPRHLVFAHHGRDVYVANEMGNSVTFFIRDPHTGKLTRQQTVSTMPTGQPVANTTTAEIVLHPGGQWLYASNRGSDTVSVFAVASSGRLKFIQTIAANVKVPRSIAIDPTGHWIITAGQNDGRLAVLKIDPQTGQLSSTANTAQVPSPVCVLFEPKS